jgi:hypothetical protein
LTQAEACYSSFWLNDKVILGTKIESRATGKCGKVKLERKVKMSRENRKFTLVFPLLCLLIAQIASAAEVLVKVDLDCTGKLSRSVQGNFTVRFIGKSFLLVQGDEARLGELSLSRVLLDRLKPNALYYLVRVGRMESRLSQLEELGDVLFTFGDSALLRIEPVDEPRLISLGLPLATLPESVMLNPQKSLWMAPRLKSQAEITADAVIISDTVNAVSADELREVIYELQENKDLGPPYKAYRSRYCLRVKETDDPSDDACDNAAEYIFNRFKSYGLDARYDPFPHEVLTQGRYQMRNVVADLTGKGPNSDRILVICSHYDSIASNSTNWLLNWKTMAAPGADDNASGTAAVLEAARILSEYDFDSTIRFITFTGEELGLHGSKHYAKLIAEDGENIAGVINFDMIAYDPDTLDIDIIANANSEWIVEAMLSLQRRYNIGPLLLNKIVNPEMVYSDHASFWHNGYSAILGIDNSDFDSPEFYPFVHTTEDTVDKLNFDMAAKMVQIAVGTLASLADPMGGMLHPDLAVADSDIYLSPENPNCGQAVQVTAYIHNLGGADAKDARVQVWLVEPLAEDSHLVAEQVVDVPAAGFAQISTSPNLAKWGDYEVLVKANPDYQIFETNGGNNIAGKTIHIGSSSLALGKLMLYPNPVRSTAEDKLNIAYCLSKDASTRLEIYSASGNLVYQRYFTSGEPGGKFGPNSDVQWDGADLSGEKVSGGIYFCYVVATDERGDTKTVSRKFLIIR